MFMLKRLALILFALSAALPLTGAECKTLVTLVPNVAERCRCPTCRHFMFIFFSVI